MIGVLRRVGCNSGAQLLQKSMSVVRSMSPMEFGKVLKGETPGNYQIIDVREPEELRLASVTSKCHKIYNYRFSEANSWSQDIVTGKDTTLLPDVPTICLCHHGMRSRQVANFLAGEPEFQEVYNMEGGIDAYARQVDPSVGTY